MLGTNAYTSSVYRGMEGCFETGQELSNNITLYFLDSYMKVHQIPQQVMKLLQSW